MTTSRKFRVLLVPDSIYWVLGTIAKSIATANPWIDATIVSGPLLGEVFGDEQSIADRFDLVHFLCPYASRDWLKRLRSKVPVVTSHHHVSTWAHLAHNLEGDAIVAGSTEWVRDLGNRGADMSRVFCVPYGVDTSLFTPATAGERDAMRAKLGLADASPAIGFFAKRASNEDDRKGTDVFADAVMALNETLPSAGVLIVGPGWHQLVNRFRDHGIRCAWIPFVVDSSEIAPLYHALDFYWVTARVEGGPVPLLEAMSSGVCCLSTGVGLAKDLIQSGVNALLLPMNDAESFARETARLWSDTSARNSIARAGRETMLSEMRADDMAQRFEPVYKRALQVFQERNPTYQIAAEKPLISPSRGEGKNTQMLEALAWSEMLVLYHDQRVAGLKLMIKAWRDNPASLEPPRTMLRRFLPGPITRGIVSLKQKLRSAGAVTLPGRD